MKKKLRMEVLEKIKQLSASEKEAIELAIHKQLLNLDLWNRAHTIAITYAQNEEWDTLALMREGWKNHKKMVIPKANPLTKEMTFYEIKDEHDVKKGAYNILEPLATEKPIKKDTIDLLIVPGLVFDTAGYRIGYGGGFYDRYLTNYKGNTVSLAATFQIIEYIPKENHDIPVQYIITNERVIPVHPS